MTNAARSLLFMMNPQSDFYERRKSCETRAADRIQFRRGLSFFYADSVKSQLLQTEQCDTAPPMAGFPAPSTFWRPAADNLARPKAAFRRADKSHSEGVAQTKSGATALTFTLYVATSSANALVASFSQQSVRRRIEVRLSSHSARQTLARCGQPTSDDYPPQLQG
jgi:hypothetical protein